MSDGGKPSSGRHPMARSLLRRFHAAQRKAGSRLGRSGRRDCDPQGPCSPPRRARDQSGSACYDSRGGRTCRARANV